MKKLIIIVVFIFNFSYSYHTYAQACGKGFFIIEIDTPLPEKTPEINYEIIPVNLTIFKEKFPEIIHLENTRPMLIKEKEALELQDISYEGQIELDKHLNFSKVKDYIESSGLSVINNIQSGAFKNGFIRFQNLENYYNYIALLKLSSKNKNIYIVTNIFRGCDKKLIIKWHESTIIYYKQGK